MNRIYTQDQINQAMDRFRLLRRNFDNNVVKQVNADKELAALLKAANSVRGAT